MLLLCSNLFGKELFIRFTEHVFVKVYKVILSLFTMGAGCGIQYVSHCLIFFTFVRTQYFKVGEKKFISHAYVY